MQSSSLKDPNISKNVNNYSVTSENNVTSNKTSHIVEFDNNIACGTIHNEQANETVELLAKQIKLTTDKCDKTSYMSKDIFYSTSFNLVDLSKATTSQDNSLFLSRTNEASILHTNLNKIKRSISRSQVQTSSDTLIEKSDDSSNEVSSKRQKLNESVCNTSARNLNDNTVTFQRNTLIAEQQNYHKINDPVQNESPNINSGDHRAGSETSNNNAQSDLYRHEDNWNEWGATNEDEWEEQEKDEDENKEIPDCLKIKKLSPNWHIVPEVINRQIGSNSLFQRRFYGSLYAVEQLQLMYKLNEHVPDCVINGLNFNQKGNLLASAVCDIINIWDWTVGKKTYCCTNNDSTSVLYAMWLPLEYFMVISGEDGRIRLLDIEHDTLKKLAKHDGRSYKLAVHPETPHVIFSAGSDSRVLSIDIRESKPKELLVVEESSLKVLLYSIQSNPSNSNELCVAGQSYCVMVYDRRKVSKPLYKLWPNCMENDEHVFVMSAMYNHNGTEILASYNNKNLFLFNRLMSSCGDYGHMYQNYITKSPLLGGNFFGPKSEYVISGSGNNIFIWDKNSQSIIQYMAGDKESVNCLEGHPHIPILATSGCDDDVKLWVPSKGELSMIESFGNHFCTNSRIPLCYGLEVPNRDENDNDDDNDDDDDNNSDSSWSDSSIIEDSQSESGDVERIQQCPPS